MDLLYFLTSAQGMEITHAVSVLLIALAAFLSYRAQRQSRENARKLDGHLQDHVETSHALLDALSAMRKSENDPK